VSTSATGPNVGPHTRRPQAQDAAKILADCRDLAIHRLVLSFSSLLDRVGDMLMERANRSLVREETVLYRTARRTLGDERGEIMAGFERFLREHIDKRMTGDAETKADFSKVDATKLTLIDTSAMDESVLTGNIKRNVENFCHEELLTLNRGMGYLLGRPDLETEANPLAPVVIVDAFAAALRAVPGEERVKLAILRELNHSSLGDLNAIYADLNRHLDNLHVVPSSFNPTASARAASAATRAATGSAGPGSPKSKPEPGADALGPEMDLMALFRQLHGGSQTFAPADGPEGLPAMSARLRRTSALGAQEANPFWMLGVDPPTDMGSVPGARRRPAHTPGGREPHLGVPDLPGGDAPDVRFLGMPDDGPAASFPPVGMDTGPYFVPRGPLPPTPSGYVPGAPVMATRELGESLTRLQAGETGFDLGDGTFLRITGIPEGKHNVLRDLQESPLGHRVNQLESMTIELVAMLFDFVFETRDLPDGIKALLARLQIPVLKAAMLDGAFFAKRIHPARILVNALAQAGLGWSAEMGHEDPLYRKIHEVVHGILDGFNDNLTIFEELRADLEQFLEAEERAADANIQAIAEEIHDRDRRESAPEIAKSQTERRIETYPVPNFLAVFLRQRWVAALEQVYLSAGDESEAWDQAVATIEDLVWSVQPKRTREDRKHLVALLPSLLKRLTTGLHDTVWPRKERERFMENLVEAHAAAVKPQAASAELPTESVAEQAKADAVQAKAAGDDAGAVKAEELAAAMARAEPVPAPAAPQAAPVDAHFLEIAQSLERGMWIEFESEGGQLAFARLAWVSPLRGTYLFTNRQGQKALSLTAQELANLFRKDQARLVEAEPLLDQAFSSMLANLGDRAAGRSN
jgi:hypothetical protein